MAEPIMESILGIEISENAVKLIQRSLVTQTIDVVHSEPLSPDLSAKPAYLAEVFRKILKQYRRQLKTKNAVVSIPSYMSFVSIVPIDPEDSDIDSQVEWEIEQQSVGKPGNSLNFDYTELTDYQPVSIGEGPNAGDSDAENIGAVQEKASHKYYLAAGASRERIEAITNALKKAKVRPLIMDVDILALANVFEFSYPEDQLEFIGIIHVSADKVSAILVRNGTYVDSFIRVVLNQGDIAGLKKLGQSIQREFENRASKSIGGGVVKKIMLAGENVLNAGYREALSSGFSKPVEVLDPFRRITIQAKIEKNVSQLGPAFAVVVGLTLRTPDGAGDD